MLSSAALLSAGAVTLNTRVRRGTAPRDDARSARMTPVTPLSSGAAHT